MCVGVGVFVVTSLLDLHCPSSVWREQECVEGRMSLPT